MDARAKFNQFLRQKGLRQTTQRDEIVKLFLRTERHLSTQELFDIVRKKDKDVGYATVARTLKLLAESGLCRMVDFGDGVQRYEHKYGHEHHDHLICSKCGDRKYEHGILRSESLDMNKAKTEINVRFCISKIKTNTEDILKDIEKLLEKYAI